MYLTISQTAQPYGTHWKTYGIGTKFAQRKIPSSLNPNLVCPPPTQETQIFNTVNT